MFRTAHVEKVRAKVDGLTSAKLKSLIRLARC